MGKVIESVIETRLNKYIITVPNRINDTQFGGLNGVSTEDASFISTLIAESTVNRNAVIYKCYIDLVKAYDRVNRKILFKVLERRGVTPKLLNLIIALHTQVMAKIRVDGEMTEIFQLDAGLKQVELYLYCCGASIWERLLKKCIRSLSYKAFKVFP